MTDHRDPLETTMVRQEAGAGRAGSHAGPTAARLALTDSVRLRVRYDENDQMGITYHARYLDWFVIGRTELLRSIGLPYARLEREGLLLPVLEVTCRYHSSTRYDDVVQLQTTLTQVQRTRVAFCYEVRLLAEDEPENESALVTTGETKHAFVAADHHPIDVRRHYPEVWRRLAPLAAALEEQRAAADAGR